MKLNHSYYNRFVFTVATLIICQQFLTACGGKSGITEHNDLSEPSIAKELNKLENPRPDQQQNAIFFKVEKDGKTSFILGSMHAGIPIKTYPDFIFKLASDANEFAFEADRDVYLNEHKEEIKMASMYRNGETLDEHLSAKGIEKLKSIYGESGYEKLRAYRPWAVEQTLSEGAKVKLTQASSKELWEVSNGIDMTLLKKAKDRKIQITFVDDLENKIESFDKNFTIEDLEQREWPQWTFSFIGSTRI